MELLLSACMPAGAPSEEWIMATLLPLQEEPTPDVTVDTGNAIRIGDRVKISPQDSPEILTPFLEGKTAIVTGIEEDLDNQVYLAITVRQDSGGKINSSHRFFFRPDEVERLVNDEAG
jgi:hypothetical protein